MSDPGRDVTGHLTIDEELGAVDVWVNSGEVWDGEEHRDVADLYVRSKGLEIVATLFEEDAEHVANRLLEAVGGGAHGD